jgi:5-methyltetrahydrofolate--homocysteine methyltransferase
MLPSAWLNFADTIKSKGKEIVRDEEWRKGNRYRNAYRTRLVKGIIEYLDDDVEEARQKLTANH